MGWFVWVHAQAGAKGTRLVDEEDPLHDHSRATKIGLFSALVSGRQGQTADVAEMSRAHLGVHAAPDLA